MADEQNLETQERLEALNLNEKPTSSANSSQATSTEANSTENNDQVEDSETTDTNAVDEVPQLKSRFAPGRIDDDFLKQIFQSQREAAKAQHKFWSTQPVKQDGSQSIIDPNALKDSSAPGPVDRTKTVEDVRKEPYNLPAGFYWDSVDIDEPEILSEVYSLLTHNYVEDDENLFRFDYSVDFIKWALKPPGYFKEWIVGVRASKDQTQTQDSSPDSKVEKRGKLLALITGVPAMVHALEETKPMAEINFLCIHKSLRSKRLAPVLIKEVTRRVNLTDRWQAVYTAGVVIPTPMARCRYYHRTLNPVKLISTGFSSLQPRMTMQRTIRLYKLPEQPTISGLRLMQKADVPQVTKLLNEYLKNFNVWIEWTEEEVEHWLVNRDGVVNSYVVEGTAEESTPSTVATKKKKSNKKNKSKETNNVDSEENKVTNDDDDAALVQSTKAGKVITDFCSFYHIPSTVIGNDKYKSINVAYSYHNVATKLPLKELMLNALIMANNLGCDVFNCLDIMDNAQFIEELKFGKGDGFLNYYLYNYIVPEMDPSRIGVVLL